MTNLFAELVAKVVQLPEHLGEIAAGILLAIRVAEIDPEMSLTRTRKVLEEIIHKVFEQSYKEPPGTRPLQELTQRLVKDKHLSSRVVIYADAVRGLGNVGTHYYREQFTCKDVAHSIGNLLVVVEWYDWWLGGGGDNPIDESTESRPDRTGRLQIMTTGRKIGAEAFLPAISPLLDGIYVPVEKLLRLYRECAPTGWEAPPTSHEPLPMLQRCVESLARAPRQAGDGLFPLFRFVRGLLDGIDAEEASAVDAWLISSMAGLGVDPEEAARLRSTLDQPSGPKTPRGLDSYLMVQVSPRLYEAGLYGVKAWFFGTGEPACLLAGEEAMTLDQIRGCLDDLRLELLHRMADPERTWVELLLPRELLCVDVDQWRVEVDFLEAIPLGVEHRLVVRSLERASRPKAAMALHARGKALGRKLEHRCRIFDGHQDGGALWIGEEECGGAGLYTTLRDAQGVVGVALGATPHPCPREPAVDVLNTLFAAGLPVVVWSRQSSEAGQVSTRDALLELLGHEPFGRLPDRVWELRKEAIRSEDGRHIGRHISLLWDDPTRTSPDFESGQRLRAPSKE